MHQNLLCISFCAQAPLRMHKADAQHYTPLHHLLLLNVCICKAIWLTTCCVQDMAGQTLQISFGKIYLTVLSRIPILAQTSKLPLVSVCAALAQSLPVCEAQRSLYNSSTGYRQQT